MLDRVSVSVVEVENAAAVISQSDMANKLVVHTVKTQTSGARRSSNSQWWPFAPRSIFTYFLCDL